MIYAMMIVRNEEHRWLKQVLFQLNKLCDKLIIIDDNSTDKTAQICIDAGAEVYINDNQLWNKNEVALRKQLWDIVIKKCKNDDWIICLDADELFIESHIPFIQYLFNTLSTQIDSIGFKLHDMWDNENYREDKWWTAHFNYWCMAIRFKKDIEYKWSDKPLHCGRFPLNSAKAMLPTEIPILHMGWSTKKDRINKYNRYMSLDGQGKNGWLEQYQSILDKKPNLKKIYKV